MYKINNDTCEVSSVGENGAVEAVELIRSFFDALAVQPEAVRRKAWWLLSALRGPDNENLAAKRQVTSLIRSQLMPRSLQYSLGNCPIVDKTSVYPVISVWGKIDDHFLGHTKAAIDVLFAAGEIKFEE